MKKTEILLKSLETILAKEKLGENIDQETMAFTKDGQWVLEKGLKSKLAGVFGAMKDRVTKLKASKANAKSMSHEDAIAQMKGQSPHPELGTLKNPSGHGTSANRPAGMPHLPKTELNKPTGMPHLPKRFEDRKLTPEQGKAAGLPALPGKSMGKLPPKAPVSAPPAFKASPKKKAATKKAPIKRVSVKKAPVKKVPVKKAPVTKVSAEKAVPAV